MADNANSSGAQGDDGSATWCTIESDPGVFTEMIARFGVKGVQMEEIYMLEPSVFADLDVHGLIFLFKWDPSLAETRRTVVDARETGVFFAKQVVTNACATQAILSILMNAADAIDLGDNLEEFRNFALDFNPELKGLQILGNDIIREAHNSFARPEPFVMEEKRQATGDDDAYHFVAYMPINGVLYELDGLREGPVDLGPATREDWVDKVCPIIQQRIERYSTKEVRFNLMALIGNKAEALAARRLRVNREKNLIIAKLISLGETVTAVPADEESMASDDAAPIVVPDDVGSLHARLMGIEDELELIAEGIAAEEDKFENWRVENIRRKHNYIPFVMNVLKVLAERKELMPLMEKARKTNQGS